jgi:hypothetical protein
MFNWRAELADGVHAAVLARWEPLGPERLAAMWQPGNGSIRTLQNLSLELEDGNVGGDAVTGRAPLNDGGTQRQIMSSKRKLNLDPCIVAGAFHGVPRSAQPRVDHVGARHYVPCGDQESAADHRRRGRTTHPADTLLQ